MTQHDIAIKVNFTKELSCFFRADEAKSLKAVARTIDSVGNKTKTVVKRAIAQQAGVTIARAGSVLTSLTTLGKGGSIVRGEYTIVCRDVTMSLKEFAARQRTGGVSAKPWGKQRFFAHAFIAFGGHVFEHSKYGVRRGPRPVHSQLPIRKLWGPALPKEMVKDQAEQTFYRTAAELLGPAIEAQLMRAVTGPS